jgi:hypothetical protein
MLNLTSKVLFWGFQPQKNVFGENLGALTQATAISFNVTFLVSAVLALFEYGFSISAVSGLTLPTVLLGWTISGILSAVGLFQVVLSLIKDNQ